MDNVTIVRSKRIVLSIFMVLAFSSGIGNYFLEEGTDAFRTFSLLHIILSTMVLMGWFVLDARQFNYTFSKPMFIALFALMIVVAPLYFIQTRGKMAWKPILAALLFFLLCGAILMLGVFVAYGGDLAHLRWSESHQT